MSSSVGEVYTFRLSLSHVVSLTFILLCTSFGSFIPGHLKILPSDLFPFLFLRPLHPTQIEHRQSSSLYSSLEAPQRYRSTFKVVARDDMLLRACIILYLASTINWNCMRLFTLFMTTADFDRSVRLNVIFVTTIMIFIIDIITYNDDCSITPEDLGLAVETHQQLC